MTSQPRASILTRLTNIPLFVLAGVNVWMVVGFWRQLGGGDPLPYQLFGACLAAVEVTFLVVAADAHGRGEVTKARTWRVVFAVVLCLNLVADFGAIVTKTKDDQIEREHRAAEYDVAHRGESEAESELNRLEAAMQASNLMLPTAAIEARLRGLEERRERYSAQGLRTPRGLVVEIATVEQALAVSRRADEVRGVRDQARARLEEFGTRPETSNAQIQGLAELAAVLGINADPETLRVVLAAALALVGKLVLVFGFWAVTPRVIAGPVAPFDPPQSIKVPPSAQPMTRRQKRPTADPSLNLAIDQLERELGSGG
jgi:hypothetical protein